jgi:fatty-acyl-CoA synthase
MNKPLSYVHGASDKPLIGQTIGRFFDEACARHAGHEALVVRHQGVRLSYAELKLKVDALACGLRRLGLEPGERIGIWSQNNVEWALTQFATAKAGLVLVNINPAYRRSELEYALNKVGCRALILSPSFKSSDYLAMLVRSGAGAGPLRSGPAARPSLPSLEMVIRMGGERTSGMLNFDDLFARPTGMNWTSLSCWASACSSTTRSTSSSPPAPPAIPRVRRCRTTTSSTTAFSWARRFACGRATGCASRCRCTTASAW